LAKFLVKYLLKPVDLACGFEHKIAESSGAGACPLCSAAEEGLFRGRMDEFESLTDL